MDEKKYVVGTFQRIQKRKIAKLAVTAPTTVVSRRMRSKAKGVFLDTINSGGLPMMNEVRSDEEPSEATAPYPTHHHD